MPELAAFRGADDDDEPPALQETESEDEESASSESESEDEDGKLPSAFDRFQGPDPGAEEGKVPTKMSEMEAVLFMLDLMTCHKTTDELGKSVWDILRTALGEEGLATFHAVKHLLNNFQRDHVVVVDICVNDCMPFHDCEDAKGWEPMHTGHLSVCEICNEDRWVVDPRTGKRKARKVVTCSC